MKFIKNIQNFASQNDLFNKKSKIIVGVSGGPDSVCLLDVLCFLSGKYDFELQIAHVNYRLRGKESFEDEKFVKMLGLKYGLKVNILRPAKKLYLGNMENILRDIRYEYFEKLRIDSKFDLIAVGHNQNDQAETVLMRIIRGSGLNGLKAMRPKTEKIIRPLLQSNRMDIVSFLENNDLAYRIDESNQRIDITRNKVRHNLLPKLRDEYNGSIVQTLCDIAYSVADDYDFISQNAERFVSFACKNKRASFLEQDFLVLHNSLQRQVLRRIIDLLSVGKKDIEYGQIEEMRKIIKSGKNKTKKAQICGLKILKKGAKIEILN